MGGWAEALEFVSCSTSCVQAYPLPLPFERCSAVWGGASCLELAQHFGLRSKVKGNLLAPIVPSPPDPPRF